MHAVGNSGLSPTAVQLKSNAEQCMKAGNYAEAFFHWTHALKLHPGQTYFLDNRCKCFLKSGQHFLAMQDATELIQLEPKSTVGYQRKAEILFAAQQYEEAIKVNLSKNILQIFQ